MHGFHRLGGLCRWFGGVPSPERAAFRAITFFSVWSAADELHGEVTSWGPNGDTTEMTATVRIDGAPYRIMGAASGSDQWQTRFKSDAPGSDLPGMPLILKDGTWQDCQALCEPNAECAGWAFGVPRCGGDPPEAQCWLKSSVPSQGVPNECRDYGIRPTPRGTPTNSTAQQLLVDVLPTRTVYAFRAGPVALNITFTTPFVPGKDGAEAWSRDASTLEATAASADGKQHRVELYFDATGDLVTASAAAPLEYGQYDQTPGVARSVWLKPALPQTFDAMQSQDRVTFARLVLAASAQWTTGVGEAQQLRRRFVASGAPPPGISVNASGASTPGSDNPVLWAAAVVDVPASGDGAKVGGGPVAVAMSFDPTFLFFGRPLRPHWTTLYDTPQDMAEAVVTNHPAVSALCAAYDANVTSQLQAAGGDDYRLVGSLAYRQSWASTTPVFDAASGERWVMLKEIS